MKRTSLFLILTLVSCCSFAQLNGKFSVSASKQVQFSKGNLVYNGSSKTFSFASNQYSVIGTSNQNISSSYTGSIDLFGWGTSGYNNCMPYETSLSVVYGGGGSSIAGTQYDWGVKNFSNYRTLTSTEWSYLFSSRSNASSLRAPAKVNDVCGWILLPDNWSLPSGMSFTSSAAGASSYTANVYTASQFSTMQSAGAVFLPAAGWRYSSGSASTVSYVNSMGYYWTSNSGTAITFGASYCYSGESAANYSGCAVRLVYDSGGGGGSTQYTITTAVSPTGTGTVTGGGTFYNGQTVTISATPADGYQLDYFERSYDNRQYSGSPWVFTATQSGTVTAYFTRAKYTIYAHVAASSGHKGSVSPEQASGYSGDIVTFTATPAKSCQFKQWDNGSTNPVYTYTIQGTSKHIYAYFESLASYSVTAQSAQPSMGNVSGSGTYPAGEKVTLTATPNKGYKVTGWDYQARFDNSPTRTIYLFGDSTCTAYFGPAESVHIDVSADASANGTVSGGGDYYEQEEVTLTATPKTGKKFVQWMRYNTNTGQWVYASTVNPYVFRATKDESFRAVFEDLREINVHVTSESEDKGTVRVTPQQTVYYYGDIITIEALPASCYVFDKWSDNDYYRRRTIRLTSDIYVQARFRQATSSVTVIGDYTNGLIRIIENGGGFVQSDTYDGCPGEVITLEAQPLCEDCFFDHWEDGNTDNPRTYILPVGQTNIYAYFNKITMGGYCGYAPYGSEPTDKAWWTYDRNSNVRIEGEGDLYDYSSQWFSSIDHSVSAAPWYNTLCRSWAQATLTIEGGITNIPNYAFAGCEGLKSVNLKNSAIREIDKFAFQWCSNLEELVLPDSLQTIWDWAFSNTGIREIILPEKLSQIDNDWPFASCMNLKRVIFTNPTPVPLNYTWIEIGTDTVYVPSGTRQAYIDAGGYMKPLGRDGFHYVIEWHKLEITVNGNGACTADTTKYIAAGDTVTLTLFPEEGSIIKNVTVTDARANSIPLTADFRFQMPESNVRVVAVFEEKRNEEGIDQGQVHDLQCTKVLRDGLLYIIRGDKIYDLTGRVVR